MPPPKTKTKREFASPEERERFILSQGALGVSVANQNEGFVNNRGLEFEDLVQAAWVEIVKAADFYDPRHESGVTFGTYSFKRLKRAVNEATAEQTNAVIVKGSRFSRCNIGKRSQRTAAAIKRAREATLITLDHQPPSSSPSPDEIAGKREQAKMLFDALADLPFAERWVVMNVHGIGCEPRTMIALSRVMGISKQRVKQIEVAGMKSLRKSLSFLEQDL